LNESVWEDNAGTRRVLIVDDVWIARRTASRFLSEAGYRVYEATSPEGARQVLQQAGGQIDLVLADVVLPQANGVKLAEELCARWPGLRVLFMSAYAAPVLSEYGLDPRLPFVQKPFSGAVLLYSVEQALAGPVPGLPTRK
jgi:CheY-like chemotaxis protein